MTLNSAQGNILERTAAHPPWCMPTLCWLTQTSASQVTASKCMRTLLLLPADVQLVGRVKVRL